MSAYIVSKAHIDVMVGESIRVRPGGSLVRWFTQPRPLPDDWRPLLRTAEAMNANLIGQMLVDTNVESVRYRYYYTAREPELPPSEALPGPINEYWWTPYQYEHRAIRVTPEELLLAIAGYEYQACEHPGWWTSEAREFCDALRNEAIHRLPGYESAKTWAISAEREVGNARS